MKQPDKAVSTTMLSEMKKLVDQIENGNRDCQFLLVLPIFREGKSPLINMQYANTSDDADRRYWMQAILEAVNATLGNTIHIQSEDAEGNAEEHHMLPGSQAVN